MRQKSSGEAIEPGNDQEVTGLDPPEELAELGPVRAGAGDLLCIDLGAAGAHEFSILRGERLAFIGNRSFQYPGFRPASFIQADSLSWRRRPNLAFSGPRRGVRGAFCV